MPTAGSWGASHIDLVCFVDGGDLGRQCHAEALDVRRLSTRCEARQGRSKVTVVVEGVGLVCHLRKTASVYAHFGLGCWVKDKNFLG